MGVLCVTGGLLVAAVALSAQGSIDTYDRVRGQAATVGHPRWTSACFADPSYGRPLVHFCARVRGRVLFVRRERGTHGTEVHFALVARLRLLIVKIAPTASLRVPGIGAAVTVVGPMIRSRFLLDEVQARSLE
jgi:hypothetical protein